MLRWIRALAIAAALTLLLAAPSRADTIRFSDLCYPGTVQSVTAEGVTLDVNGTPVLVPSTLGTFDVNGRAILASDLKTGDVVVYNIPAFDGTLESTSGGFITVKDSSGRHLMLPITAINNSVLASSRTYVRLHNGNIVQVPLNTALNMQFLEGATILSSLPTGATVMTVEQASPITCHRVGTRTLNVIDTTVSTDADFNEDVPNLRGIDNGNGNFDEPTGGFDRLGD